MLTLKAVRTGGELITQKTTIAIVETQEELMLARVKFQNQLADLRLTDATQRELSKR